MGRFLFLFGLTIWLVLGNTAPVLAQRAEQSQEKQAWDREAVQRILRYLHVSGTDLIVASAATRKINPSGDRVVLLIKVESGGRIASVGVARSSGHANLDQIAARLVRQAGPLPPWPGLDPNPVYLPLKFHAGRYGRKELFELGR